MIPNYTSCYPNHFAVISASRILLLWKMNHTTFQNVSLGKWRKNSLVNISNWHLNLLIDTNETYYIAVDVEQTPRIQGGTKPLTFKGIISQYYCMLHSFWGCIVMVPATFILKSSRRSRSKSRSSHWSNVFGTLSSWPSAGTL